MVDQVYAGEESKQFQTDNEVTQKVLDQIEISIAVTEVSTKNLTLLHHFRNFYLWLKKTQVSEQMHLCMM